MRNEQQKHHNHKIIQGASCGECQRKCRQSSLHNTASAKHHKIQMNVKHMFVLGRYIAGWTRNTNFADASGSNWSVEFDYCFYMRFLFFLLSSTNYMWFDSSFHSNKMPREKLYIRHYFNSVRFCCVMLRVSTTRFDSFSQINHRPVTVTITFAMDQRRIRLLETAG